jgi:hypothetical protein
MRSAARKLCVKLPESKVVFWSPRKKHYNYNFTNKFIFFLLTSFLKDNFISAYLSGSDTML